MMMMMKKHKNKTTQKITERQKGEMEMQCARDARTTSIAVHALHVYS